MLKVEKYFIVVDQLFSFQQKIVVVIYAWRFEHNTFNVRNNLIDILSIASYI